MKTCKCGCGAEISEHATWARGHNAKQGVGPGDPEFRDPNPSGLCFCGCGGPTSIATYTNARDLAFRGMHRRYITGHHSKTMIGADRRGNWKGGRIVTDEGYVKVRVTLDGGRRAYVHEHRWVMSQVLGRDLAPNEQVHHINGDKQDNRPENLELWHRSQPNGVRREDYHCPGCRCSEK